MRLWRPPRRLDQGEEASLVEHLEELRQRIFTCIGAVVVAAIVAFVFHRRLIHWLEQPLPAKHRELVTFSPGEPFMTSIWVSIWAGFLISMPIVLWQVWAFFIPAFDKSHETVLKVFVFVSSALLVAGVVFGYFVALPAAVHFLTNYDNSVYTVMIRARDYISFATKVLLAMAIVFELPIFVVGLTRLGILTTDKLRKNRRIGYFIVACVGVALPGVDPVTTVFETVPLAVLYELSIWASVLLDRRSARSAAAVAGV